jgi:intracellular septation protein
MKFLFDFFPVLLFFVVYKTYDIYAATATAIVASFVQVGVYWLRHRRFENAHLITLAVIVVFGGMTLLFRDPLFIKWKPTIVNWLFAIAFAGSRYFGEKTLVERMMGQAVNLPTPIWQRLNLAWIAFFLTMGAANLYVAYHYSEDTWVNFKLFGMMGLTLAFVFLQAFFIARHVIEPPREDA